MEEKIEQAYLYDFYGELLNEHQRKIYEDFVFNDLSLGEIADEEGISRQGEGAEMWRPLGVAVIGGLTVSTILTLILVPVLYCSFAGIGIRRNRRKIKKDRELNDYYQVHKEKMTKPRKQ